jgi:hypothetical protein
MIGGIDCEYAFKQRQALESMSSSKFRITYLDIGMKRDPDENPFFTFSKAR